MSGRLVWSPRFLLPLGGVALLAALGLVLWQALPTEAGPVAVPDPVYRGSGASYPRAHSIEEIVGKADVVFVGRVAEVGGVQNGARLQQDPSQPDPNVFAAERKYYVIAEEDLSSNTPEEVVVVQSEGAFRTGEMTLEEWEEVRHNMALPRFTPMEVGATYTFLLRKSTWDPEIWAPAAQPYRFRHVRDRRALPEGTYTDSGEGFEILGQEALKSRVLEGLAKR